MVGCGRLGDPLQAEMLDAIYRELWNPWRNFLCRPMRLVEKRREGSKIRRRYDKAQAPLERLKGSGKADRNALEGNPPVESIPPHQNGSMQITDP